MEPVPEELTRPTVESVVAHVHSAFRWPLATASAVRLGLIQANFRWHYERNRFYRKLCDGEGVSPGQIRTEADLDRIPLIPVRYFKQPEAHLLLSVPLQEIEFEMRSTGTSGLPSVSRRDPQTLTRGLFVLGGLYREFFGFARGAGLLLCPSTEEMPEMGMVKVLNLLRGFFDASEYAVRRLSFQPQQVVETLRRWEGTHTRHIIGPPFLVNRLLRHLLEQGTTLPLDRGSRILTIGGWKRFTGDMIPRAEFDRRCADRFAINPDQVRDMYGLVEANMLAIECEHQVKHVPPWVRISARHTRNLAEPLPAGRRGALAILDPISLSYPCFLLTEDVGRISMEGTCACGRTGTGITFLNRLAGAELGCCAINLDRFMAETDEGG